jgi:hypothetical protein
VWTPKPVFVPSLNLSTKRKEIMKTRFVKTNQPRTQADSIKKTKRSKIASVFGAVLLGALTGCIGYVDGPRYGRVYAQPPSVQVQAGSVVQDEYVYYPGYEVYYSGHTRQYVYLDGNAWVSRPAPPRVSVDVLFASPSVRLDFHDAPSTHHATVVQTYPRNWTPPGWSHGHKGGNKKDKERGN